ncbi:hypothetical protein [Mucilaginibacter endophyticus]|uniref:hypothetical protein n=1 Tax=Mucilaginibacter endophyticus TaxID=2675003 RepID=UPI000E0D4ED5|nr:hypothetical protein [Mucilaginibacter endophyticus]
MTQGDVLTFLAADNRYKMIICTSIYNEKSPHNYTFAALTYNSEKIPTVVDAVEDDFWGVANIRNDIFKYSNSELENMWMIHPEIKRCQLGSYGFIIWRKDYLKFKDKMMLIGNLKIINNLDKNGNGGVNASSWSFLQGFFNNEVSSVLKYKSQKMFKVRSILCE